MKKSTNEWFWNSSRAFDFVMEILLLITIFLIPTIFDRRLGIVFSGTKVTFLGLLGSILLGVWAIKILIFREHRFARTPLDWPLLTYLLCVTVAVMTSVHVYTSMVGFYGRYEGLTTWYLYGLVFFVVTNYIRSFEQIKRIVMTVVPVTTIMSVYSIIQRFEIDPYLWGGVVTRERVIGTIGQPNFLAAYMLMAFFLILALFLMPKPGSEKKINWYEQFLPLLLYLAVPVVFLIMIYNLDAENIILWYFGFLVMTAASVLLAFYYESLHPFVLETLLGLGLLLAYICILYTQSRGGYMGLFMGMVLFFLVAGRKVIFDNWKKLALLGFLIVLISGITISRAEFSPFQRFTSEITTEQKTNEEKEATNLELRGAAGSRGETWKSAFRIIADNPLFGIGPEVLKMVFPRYETDLFRFKEAFHVKQDRCHNEIFDISVTKGLLSFFVYLWLITIFFYTGWTKARQAGIGEKALLAGLLAAALAYLIQNQFSFGVVAITSLFWVIWGMTMVVGEEAASLPPKKFSWEDVPWLQAAAVIAVVLGLIYYFLLSFRGDIWFKSGKTALEFHHLDEAAVQLEKSLAIYPFEGTTISHLGITYLNLAQMTPEKNNFLEKAVLALNYGTLVDPFNADNFYMLSRIYFTRYSAGDKAALNLLETYADNALKIDPYYAEVYFNLGMVFEKEGESGKAAAMYEKAFMINPNLTEPMDRIEELNRHSGRPEGTLKVLERARARYADNFTVLEKVAALLSDRKQFNDLLTVADQMVKIDAQNSNGYIFRAEAYLGQNNLEKSFSDLQQVIVNDPGNINAHNVLGQYYLKKGDRQKAKEEYQQVLILDPQNQPAKEMLGRL